MILWGPGKCKNFPSLLRPEVAFNLSHGQIASSPNIVSGAHQWKCVDGLHICFTFPCVFLVDCLNGHQLRVSGRAIHANESAIYVRS